MCGIQKINDGMKQIRNRLTDTESKLVVTSGLREAGKEKGLRGKSCVHKHAARLHYTAQGRAKVLQ